MEQTNHNVIDEGKRKAWPAKLKLRPRDYIFLVILLIGMVAFAIQKIMPNEDSTDVSGENVIMMIKDVEISAELAKTDEERFKGLSGRESMRFDHGMMFVFDSAEKHPFVMRDMLFDLDFIFIKDGRVVDIAKNVAREFPGNVVGGTEYDRVLEVNAGWARRHGIRIGDSVILGE